MDWLSKDTKRLILEMCVGIILFNVVLAVIACLVLPGMKVELPPVLIGLATGMISAIAMLIDMGVSTDRVLTVQDENYATRMTLVHSIARKVIFVLILLCVWRFFRINLLAAVIGAMGMKAGAYLQPLVHKASTARNKGGNQEAS